MERGEELSEVASLTSYNASMTYLLGDAHCLAGAEEALRSEFDKGEIFGAQVYVVTTAGGDLLWVSSQLGAGAASIHRIGSRIILTEPPVGALQEEREQGDLEIPADAEAMLRKALHESPPPSARPLGTFEVKGSAMAAIYSNAQMTSVSDACTRLTSDVHAARVGGEDSHGAVLKTPAGRFNVYGRWIDFAGNSIWSNEGFPDEQAWYVVDIVSA